VGGRETREEEAEEEEEAAVCARRRRAVSDWVVGRADMVQRARRAAEKSEHKENRWEPCDDSDEDIGWVIFGISGE
jgi:hypothetical protein